MEHITQGGNGAQVLAVLNLLQKKLGIIEEQNRHYA